MRITIEDKTNERTVVVVIDSELREETLDEVLLDLVAPALAALGFQQKNIHEALNVPW